MDVARPPVPLVPTVTARDWACAAPMLGSSEPCDALADHRMDVSLPTVDGALARVSLWLCDDHAAVLAAHLSEREA